MTFDDRTGGDPRWRTTKQRTPSAATQEGDVSRARSLLYLLWAIDLLLIAISAAAWTTGIVESQPALNIEYDGGLGETFQYLKWAAILVGLILCFRASPSRIYVVLFLLFSYLLLDDSLGIHERMGGTWSAWAGFVPMVGLRAVDFGEMAVVAVVVAIFAGAMAWSYATSRDPTARRYARAMLGLLLLLGFFGVAVDMLHVVVWQFEIPILTLAAGLIEDGGEMLTASAMVFVTMCETLSLRKVRNPPLDAMAKPADADIGSAGSGN
jgi:hypothetical protein